MKRWLVLFVAAASLGGAAAEDPIARVRAWRSAHEPQIPRELFDFLALPNVAANKGDIEKNAQALTRMFEKRRFLPEVSTSTARTRTSASGTCGKPSSRWRRC
jgi:hypothetical protein